MAERKPPKKRSGNVPYRRPERPKEEPPAEQSHTSGLTSRRNFLFAGSAAAAALATGAYFVLSGHDNGENATPPIVLGDDTSPEHVAKVYAALYDELKNLSAKAQKSGKKLLVMLGDCHDSDQGLMMEVMVLDIMRQLHPNEKHLFMEELAATAERIEKKGLGAEESGNIPALAGFGNKVLGYALHGVDDEDSYAKIIKAKEGSPEHAEAVLDEVHPKRDSVMGSNISAVKYKAGIIACGASHMMGITEKVREKSPDTLIAAMNITQISKDNIDELRTENTPNIARAMRYAIDPKNAAQLPVTDVDKPARRTISDTLLLVNNGIRYYNTVMARDPSPGR